MNRSDWKKMDEILAAALDLEPMAHSSFIRAASQGDEELFRNAEVMLAAIRQADANNYLDQNAFSVGAAVLAESDRVEYERIGKYKIIHEIGRGGMGRVLLGEHEDFHHRVAIKIIKRGMDTDEIIRRFERERAVLGTLSHRYIANLIDGGTTDDGLPYLVMEYVEGEPVTKYCDQNKLGIDDRLGLFRKICDAVSFAHQNLVVHRDIKPSNILIDGNGEPKLLDFGIAKLLVDNGDTQSITEAGLRLMTPEYASPEQIRGEKITTASDIYSLGVLLYELLCGHRPFRLKNRTAPEIVRIIAEREPSAPSTAALTAEEICDEDDTKQIISPETIADLRSDRPQRLSRRLNGDLDNIVLKSLFKEPLRRYHTVEQFAEDLRRHLDGLPVLARPATLGYHISKFVNRNRTAVTFASIALLAVLIGSSAAIWQAVVASVERSRAERRADEVRRLTDSLLKDLEKDIAALPGSGPAVIKLSNVSIEYLKGLAQETDDPAVWTRLSEAYVLLGKQHGNADGDPADVNDNIVKGLEISRTLTERHPEDLDAKKLLAKNLEEYDYFCAQGPLEKIGAARERTRLREEIAAATPDDPLVFYELFGAYGSLNYLLTLYGDETEAVTYRRLGMEACKREIQLLEKADATVRERDLLALAYMSLGQSYSGEGDLVTAEANFRQALAVAEDLVAKNPDYRLAWTRRAAAGRDLAEVREKQGDYQGALEQYRESLRLIREGNRRIADAHLQGAEPGYVLEVAENLFRTGQNVEARQMMSEARSVYDRTTGFGFSTARDLSGRAAFLRWTANVYAQVGLVSEALAACRESEDLWKRFLANDPKQAESVARELAKLSLIRGNAYATNAAHRAQAVGEYKNVVETLSNLRAKNKIHLEDLVNLRTSQERLRTMED